MKHPELPRRVFSRGAEPRGERVHYYGELDIIDQIGNALDPEEMATLRNSQFGKLLDIPIEPAYSGKLVHFVLTRQLRIKKKHEFWFVFGGSPIRFSIEEFESVTGLSCGNLPRPKGKRGKRKVMPGPYWFQLFGKGADVNVPWVINRLKKRLVTDKDMRLRYAVLALIDGVLCPTSGNLKISPIHAEMSEHLDIFLAHHWGTQSFEMTLKSIAARGANKLRRKSITVQGFPHAVQLVLLQAIPAIKEVQFPREEEDSDSEIEYVPPEIERLYTLKLDPIWKLDRKDLGNVVSIVKWERSADTESLASWHDEVPDASVSALLNLIAKNHRFTASMFSGGLLPGEAVDLGEVAGDVSSDDEFDVYEEPPHGVDVGSSCNTRKNTVTESVAAVPVTHDYVTNKVKSSEARMLKAIGEMEERLLKAISSRKGNERGTTCNGVEENIARPHGSGSMTVSKQAATAEKQQLGDESQGKSTPPPVTRSKRKIPEIPADDTIIGSVLQSLQRTEVETKKNEGEACWHSVEKRRRAASIEGIKGSRQTETDNCDGSAVSVGSTEQEAKKQINEVQGGPGLKSGGDGEDSERTKQQPGPETIGTTLREIDSTASTPMELRLPKTQPSVPPMSTELAIVPFIPPIGHHSATRMLKEKHCGNLLPLNTPPHHNFGYDLEQLEKITRITAKDSVIDFGGGRALTTTEVRGIVELREVLPPLAMNIFVNALRKQPLRTSTHSLPPSASFMDWDFVLALTKHYQKFSRSTDKGMFAFDDYLLTNLYPTNSSVYMPFCFDNQHWVALCANFTDWTITVLDSYTSLWREPKIKTHLAPLAEMLPYLIRYASTRKGEKRVILRPLLVEREKQVTQVCFRKHSGVMTVALIEAHATGGVDACTRLKSIDVFGDVKKYIIAAYEASNGSI